MPNRMEKKLGFVLIAAVFLIASASAECDDLTRGDGSCDAGDWVHYLTCTGMSNFDDQPDACDYNAWLAWKQSTGGFDDEKDQAKADAYDEKKRETEQQMGQFDREIGLWTLDNFDSFDDYMKQFGEDPDAPTIWSSLRPQDWPTALNYWIDSILAESADFYLRMEAETDNSLWAIPAAIVLGSRDISTILAEPLDWINSAIMVADSKQSATTRLSIAIFSAIPFLPGSLGSRLASRVDNFLGFGGRHSDEVAAALKASYDDSLTRAPAFGDSADLRVLRNAFQSGNADDVMRQFPDLRASQLGTSYPSASLADMVMGPHGQRIDDIYSHSGALQAASLARANPSPGNIDNLISAAKREGIDVRYVPDGSVSSGNAYIDAGMPGNPSDYASESNPGCVVRNTIFIEEGLRTSDPARFARELGHELGYIKLRDSYGGRVFIPDSGNFGFATHQMDRVVDSNVPITSDSAAVTAETL